GSQNALVRAGATMQSWRFVLPGLLMLAGAPVLNAQAGPAITQEQLLERIRRLEERIARLESREPLVTDPPPTTPPDPEKPQPIGGTTFNVDVDGYYSYNFNQPPGRANLFRAYDVSSNSFSLNQAGIVIERAPNPDIGRRMGLRLDLQFGQATET